MNWLCHGSLTHSLTRSREAKPPWKRGGCCIHGTQGKPSPSFPSSFLSFFFHGRTSQHLVFSALNRIFTRPPLRVWAIGCVYAFILNADSSAAKLVTAREWNTCKTWPGKQQKKFLLKKSAALATPTLFFFLLHFSSIPQSIKRWIYLCSTRFVFLRVFVLKMGSSNLLKTASEEAAAEVCLS